MHITNQALNRNANSYTVGTDVQQTGTGNRWYQMLLQYPVSTHIHFRSIDAYLHYLRESGYNDRLLWQRVQEVVVKTIISVQHKIAPATRAWFNSTQYVRRIPQLVSAQDDLTCIWWFFFQLGDVFNCWEPI
jgi:hypothetical protein